MEKKQSDFGWDMPVLHGLLYSLKTTLHSYAQSGFELDGATLSALNLIALPLCAWIEWQFLDRIITKSTITAMSIIMMGVGFIAVFKFKDKGKSHSNTVTNSLNFARPKVGGGEKKDGNLGGDNENIGNYGKFDVMNDIGNEKIKNRELVKQGEINSIDKNETTNMIVNDENKSKLSGNENDSYEKYYKNIDSKESNSKLNESKESNSKLNDTKLNESKESHSKLNYNLSHNNSEINSQNDLIENIFKSSTNKNIKPYNDDNLRDEENSLDSETPNTDNLYRYQDIEPESDNQNNFNIKFRKMIAHILGTILECFIFLIVYKTFEYTNYSTTYYYNMVNLYKLIFTSLQGFILTYYLQAYNPNMLSAIQLRYEQYTYSFFTSDDFNLSQMSKYAYLQAISSRFSTYYYIKKAQVSVLGVKINCWGQVISPFVFATETIMQEYKQPVNIITIIGMIYISLGIKMHAITQMRQAKYVRDQGNLSKQRSNGNYLDFS
eukprot:Mrub_01587.p1 GENE.Mrub_01587~~Mrub_01587.p1  ORF type:complete len:571 (+),score=112.84 Mrub_01587:233-1714(+)